VMTITIVSGRLSLIAVQQFHSAHTAHFQVGDHHIETLIGHPGQSVDAIEHKTDIVVSFAENLYAVLADSGSSSTISTLADGRIIGIILGYR
jgi:hypothetical protein